MRARICVAASVLGTNSSLHCELAFVCFFVVREGPLVCLFVLAVHEACCRLRGFNVRDTRGEVCCNDLSKVVRCDVKESETTFRKIKMNNKKERMRG